METSGGIRASLAGRYASALFDLARDRGANVIAATSPCAGHYSETCYAVVARVLLQYLEIVQGAPPMPPWSEP